MGRVKHTPVDRREKPPAALKAKSSPTKSAKLKEVAGSSASKKAGVKAASTKNADKGVADEVNETEEYFNSDEDEDLDVEVIDLKSAMKKCRPPPSQILAHEWTEKYGLEGTGDNPKRFTPGFKTAAEMVEVFGKRAGKKGRNGYRWQDCSNADIMARVRKLHSLIYGHDPLRMPSHLKVKFAEGIVHEHQHGIGSVNWAAFAQVVNNTQRTTRGKRAAKLEYMKEQGMSCVTKEEFRSLKLEPGELKRLELADGAKKDMSEVCGSRIPTKQEHDLCMRTLKELRAWVR